MESIHAFMESLRASGFTPKMQFQHLERFARDLESELARKGPLPADAPHWLHSSERLPDRAGRFMTVTYSSKSDSRVLMGHAFDGARWAMPIGFEHMRVAYWLEGLDPPEGGRRPAAAPPGLTAAAGRVERFIASLPEFRAGPKTRIRFLESYAAFLEEQLSPPRSRPRWVSCRERVPRDPGKYIAAVRASMGGDLELRASPYADGAFSCSTPGVSVVYWLEGMAYPPFYYQASHAPSFNR